MQEVVALEELVGKFGKGQAVAGFAVEAPLHAVLGHHVVDGDVFADFACEIQEGISLHPVIVVDQLGSVGRVALEIEEAGQLCFDAAHVVSQRFLVEEVSLGTFARGVAYHAGCAADQGQRFVAGALKVAEHHDAAQVADVQRVGCGVNSHVGSSHALGEHFLCAGHHLVEHAAPPEFFYEIHIG